MLRCYRRSAKGLTARYKKPAWSWIHAGFLYYRNIQVRSARDGAAQGLQNWLRSDAHSTMVVTARKFILIYMDIPEKKQGEETFFDETWQGLKRRRSSRPLLFMEKFLTKPGILDTRKWNFRSAGSAGRGQTDHRNGRIVCLIDESADR